MTDLITMNKAELQNQKLVTQLGKINRAYLNGEKNKWTIANAVNEIISKKLYEDDFAKEEALAAYMGMSRPTINKMKRASDYHANISSLAEFKFSQVVEMLTIEESEIDNFLIEYVITEATSARDVREAVKQYKVDKEAIDTTATDVEDTDAENTDAEDTEAETTTDNTVDVGDVLREIDKVLVELNDTSLVKVLEYARGLLNE